MKKLLILMLLVMIIPVVLAQTSLDEVKPNTNVTLIQVSPATECNITAITYPNSSVVLSGIVMTSSNNHFTYNLNDTYTRDLGTYSVYGICTDGTDNVAWAYDFDVTVSGTSLDETQGLISVSGLVVMALVATLLFIFSFRFENGFAKFAFITLTGIMVLISVLYSVVLVQQSLSEFTSITQGYETFMFVVKMFFTVAIVALMIVALLVAVRYYKFKRGWID